MSEAPDRFGAAQPGPHSDDPKPPWFKRRGLLVAAGVVVVIGAAVVTDLPQHPSLAAQVISDSAAVKAINADAAACAYAVGEAFTIRGYQVRRTLTVSDKGKAPALLQQDQIACSFTAQPINDLATIELPGSSAGRSLEQLVNSVTLWTSSDADAAIIDINELFDDPGAKKPLGDLKYRERLLSSDRVAALRALARSEATLHARIGTLGLPELPFPPATAPVSTSG